MTDDERRAEIQRLNRWIAEHNRLLMQAPQCREFQRNLVELEQRRLVLLDELSSSGNVTSETINESEK